MADLALLHEHVSSELAAARAAAQASKVDEAWRRLERAHILSQPGARLHTAVHLAMLQLALRTRDGREVWGQLVRVAVAALGSLTGRFPLGNTGRARVPLTQPMPIAEDLASVLAAAGAGRSGAASG